MTSGSENWQNPEISWSMQVPARTPQSWHFWDLQKIAENKADAAYAATDAALGWPRGATALLHAAFAGGMTRNTGFESEVAEHQAVAAAARVFRRGVGCRVRGREMRALSASGRYPVMISRAPELPAGWLQPGAFQIWDGTVKSLWPSLPAGQTAAALQLQESSKTLDSVADILGAWRRAGSPRHWQVVGGGLVSDVAAFACDLAGCSIEFIPTTLLAMADACVGGKTGVNFPPYGKNQVGTFFFPTAVRVWTGWLSTLDGRGFAAGGAECLKHILLQGTTAEARRLADLLARRDLPELAAMLPRIIQVKADVVARDPVENGERATLNFGHTLAHALESWCQQNHRTSPDLLHGEAVALGLGFALILSQTAGVMEEREARELLGILAAAQIIPSPQLRTFWLGGRAPAPAMLEQLWPWIRQDKKVSDRADGESTWVLLQSCGAPLRSPAVTGNPWTVSLADGLVRQAWARFCAWLEQV